MSSTSRSKCVECGSELPPGLPVGLCPCCALRTAAERSEANAPAAATVPFSQPGDRIGRYKLLQQIGEGGFGVVFMAEQEEPIRRKVALKVIKLGMDTRAVIARFEAERQALALMDHPNIAKVVDAGATETGRPYFVMELVKGVRITDYCDQHNLSTRARLDLFIQVCHAIQHAHQKGIIHRDIKPSNILVTLHDGVPVPQVIDFGIAKATSDLRLTEKTLFTAFDQFMGTPAYMSPEQAEMSGLDIDTRSDIYSLGVLLYELLTGKTPFDAKELWALGFEAMVRTIREKEPAKPSTRLSTMVGEDVTAIAHRRQTEPTKLTKLLRGDLDWIVMKCLEKDRTRRYETASDLAAEILRYFRNELVVARPPTTICRFQKTVRRNKLAFAAAAAVLTALVLGGILSTWQAVRATRAERAQSHLRTEAETAGTTAQAEARRAEAAATEAKMTLAASDFLQGVRLSSDDNRRDALAFLARSLTANPTNRAAMTRLTSLLTSRSWMQPVFFLNHDSPAICAQFSPDGKRIVTGELRFFARVWDAQTGLPLTKPLQNFSSVDSVHFSPDGKRFVAVTSYRWRVWDAQSGEVVTESKAPTGEMVFAELSPDGTRFVTASADNTIRIWDVQTGQLRPDPMKHQDDVRSVHFSPDGTRIVSASTDQTARVWDAQTGQPLTEPMLHGGGVVMAEFSPDGNHIVTVSTDNAARAWDAQTGQPQPNPMKHVDEVRSARFSPDGTRIVTASADHTARVWDARTGQPLTKSMRHPRSVNSAQFSSDGKRILTASSDSVRIWEAQTGQPIAEPMKHANRVVSVQFSPDGKRILTASHDKTVCVWEGHTSPPLTEAMRHFGAVNSAEYSLDGKRIVTASMDKTACVWDAQSGQPMTEPMKHEQHVVSAHFSPDGKRIVTTSYDQRTRGRSEGAARVWDAQTGKPLMELVKIIGEVASAQFSPDGQRIVTASSERSPASRFAPVAQVWDAETGQLLTDPMVHPHDVVDAQFSPDGKRIVTASATKTGNGTASVWDAQTGKPLGKPMRHISPLNTAQFSPDGKRIVTGSWDNTARVWDAETGQPLTQPLEHDGGSVRVVRFSRDGKRIVTAGTSLSARVWDAETGHLLTDPMPHSASVTDAQFSPDGSRIVTASRDGTARVWDTQTGQPLTEPMRHGNDVLSARFSPDGQRVVTASADRTTRVWDLAPGPAQYPDWLISLTEAIGGVVINKQGVLEPTKLNGIEALKQIRQRLTQETGDDDWVVWGRWILADRATRTISPFSKITVPQYIENRIREKTPESLAEAERLADGNPELSKKIAETRKLLDQAR